MSLTLQTPSPLRSDFVRPDISEWAEFRNSLAESQAFLSPYWAEAWVNSYLPHDRWRGPCRHLSVFDANGLVTGIFSFAEIKYGPFKFWSSAGPYSPYRGIPISADPQLRAATCEALVDALTDFQPLRLGLRFGPVLGEDAGVLSLAATLQRRGWEVGVADLGSIFVLQLPGDVGEWTAENSAFIKKIRYYERRLSKRDTVVARKYTGEGADGWPETIENLATIELNSWVSKDNGRPKVSTLSDKAFWRRVAADSDLKKMLVVWLLFCGSRPISFSLNLENGTTKHIIANLHDEEFRDHSPGNILAHYVLKDAIERSVRTVEWGQGDSGYKQRWHARRGSKILDFIAFPPGLMGLLSKRLFEGREGFTFRPGALQEFGVTPAV